MFISFLTNDIQCTVRIHALFFPVNTDFPHFFRNRGMIVAREDRAGEWEKNRTAGKGKIADFLFLC
jgi:hypothetical protein